MPAPLEIEMFPSLSDNYGFLVHSPDTGETAAIDTPDVSDILDACEFNGWTLTHIWNTHHHFDHVGGNLALQKQLGVEILGPGHDQKRIPGITRGVSGGESFDFGGHSVHVIDTPGHTTSHIIYHIPSMKAAFVGDTIFVMGCGRLFEGTPAQMHDSLNAIAAMPPATKLYCAHEYTLSNGAFALTVEPDNEDLIAYMEQAKAMREDDIPTVPTTVGMELKINPFMRAGSAERLGEIRAAKDNF